jgi:hypothetical protein
LKKFLFVTVFTLFGYFLSAQATGKVITYLDCLYSYIKGTSMELSNSFVTAYIRDFYYDVYRQYSNNEFEWYDKLEQYKTELSQKSANQDLNVPYVIVTGVNFGNYDFNRNGFPVTIEEGTFFPLVHTNNIMYLNRIGLFLADFYKYNFFLMDSNASNDFVRSRTAAGGSVNREVRLIIYFNIMNFSSPEYINISSGMNRNYIPVGGTINRIEVYDNTIKISDLVMK